MKEPIQECTDLRMLAALFPRCDTPTTVTEHVQTCLHDVTIRAAKRLEAAEDDLRSTEQYVEYLHQVLGITGTPKAEVMKLDPEYLRRRWADAQAALDALQNSQVSDVAEDEGAPAQTTKFTYSAENLLESVTAARNAFECLCHSIFSVFDKGVE